MLSRMHLFSPSYPSFAPLGGVMQELAGGGDSSRKKSKVSPPWVCEKCAKKHPSELGCGETSYEVVEGEVIPDPSDTAGYYFVRTTDDVDAVLGCGRHQPEVGEQLGCDKCKEGQRKKRKKAAEAAAQNANGWGTLYNMRGPIRVTNMGHTHRVTIGQTTQNLACPLTAPALDPSLNCMRDARGNAVCSDGTYYPPGCPHTPPDSYFTPGVTPDYVANGIIQGQVPPPRGGASAPGAPGAPASTGTVVAAGAGVIGIGALLFMLFR